LPEPIRLFSYGTLQQKEVQLANYGRELEGEADALAGYVLEQVAISRADVVDLSGKAIHSVARPTGNPADQVSGMVFLLTEAELTASDAYEDAAYKRVEVTLASGQTAWAYVAAGS
jgi:gamma-glutamylcyclotransferase (GGCT)/AIG2-like uncharacterized protein YtfP